MNTFTNIFTKFKKMPKIVVMNDANPQFDVQLDLTSELAKVNYEKAQLEAEFANVLSELAKANDTKAQLKTELANVQSDLANVQSDLAKANEDVESHEITKLYHEDLIEELYDKLDEKERLYKKKLKFKDDNIDELCLSLETQFRLRAGDHTKETIRSNNYI